MTNRETPIGKITVEKELRPSDFHLTIRGNGRCVLVVANEHRHVAADLLLPVLHEVVRQEFPNVELPDVGPGPRAIEARSTELEKLADRALIANDQVDLIAICATTSPENTSCDITIARFSVHEP